MGAGKGGGLEGKGGGLEGKGYCCMLLILGVGCWVCLAVYFGMSIGGEDLPRSARRIDVKPWRSSLSH